MMSEYHVPVLLKQSVDGLVVDKSGCYVDVTFGGGGHSRLILSQLSQEGKLISFDQDEEAKQNLINDERFEFVDSNFRFLKNFLKVMNVIPVDGILADLGVSSHQFDVPQRGFSIRFEGPLDMRMSQGLNITAADVVNTYDEKGLRDVFYQFGEVKIAKKLAQEIVLARGSAPLKTTQNLIDLVKGVAGQKMAASELPKIFQALRIEVNQELHALKDLLKQSLDVLKTGGRLVVISYHSLEDRLVKNFMRSGNFEGKVEKDFYGNLVRPIQPVFTKAIVPNAEEIAENPRSRSAKLRIAEKL
jgi:16S rRNA (cytosine1402-N4)-methyltransferase